MKPSARFFSALLLLSLLGGILASCAPVVVTATPAGVTVTPNPFSTATPTPFQPENVSATFTPVPSLTPTLIPSVTATGIPSSPTISPTSPATPSAVVRPTYVLTVTMDYSAHAFSVDETITYTNQTGESLSGLVLAVEPNRWNGAFWLTALSVNGIASTTHILNGYRLDIPLAEPLDSSASLSVNLQYTLVPSQTSSANIFGYNSFQVNLLDWYPFIVPYVPGSGWLIHDPVMGVGEHLVYDPADFSVRIHASGPALQLTIAASAPAVMDEDDWLFTLQNSRTFVFSASPQYLATSTTVGNVTITSYYAASNRTAGEAILQAAAQAVAVYTEQFAPYPYSSLSIVEALFPDGMEADGLVFLSANFYSAYNGTVTNNLTSIGVHEIAHQWWFALVGNDQALEPWLDEALSTYSERIFYAQTYPSLINWWWNFRIKPFNPSGYIDITIYQGGSFRPYTNAVYLRGAYFLDAIRVRMGDEDFSAFLKDYTAQMSWKRATAADFFRILRLHTSADISDIVALYFQTPH